MNRHVTRQRASGKQNGEDFNRPRGGRVGPGALRAMNPGRDLDTARALIVAGRP